MAVNRTVGALDIVITEPLESLLEKLCLSEILDRRGPGEPSLCDLLIEERRLERLREQEEEGW